MAVTITGYHAHVYYDAISDDPAWSKQTAAAVREEAAKHFPDAVIGRWHDNPIGPHPKGSFQIAFNPELFGLIIPWLATNRRGLTIFIHTETGHDLHDHRDYPMWMGSIQDLDLSLFEDDES